MEQKSNVGHGLHVHTVIKLTKQVSFKKLSQQGICPALQEPLGLESLLWAAAKGTNSQDWMIPRINGDNLKYNFPDSAKTIAWRYSASHPRCHSVSYTDQWEPDTLIQAGSWTMMGCSSSMKEPFTIH
jgi:hypothetical protein